MKRERSAFLAALRSLFSYSVCLAGWVHNLSLWLPAIRGGVDELLAGELRREIRADKRTRFLMLKDFTEVTARVPKPEAVPRQAEYISAQELGAAMLAIISATYGITDEDLIEEAARVFGYERKGPKIMKAMKAALSRLKRKELVRVIDEKLQLGYDS